MKAHKITLAVIALLIAVSVDLAGQCVAPKLLQQHYVSKNSVEAKWRPDTNADHYETQIRATGTTNWTADTTSSIRYTFSNLSACLNHELRIRSVCSGSNSSWSPLVKVITSGCLETPENLRAQVSAVSTGSKIYIRWVPMDFDAMKWGATYGYTLTRTTLMRADTLLDPMSSRASKTIINELTLPLQDTLYWDSLSDINDMVGVAAGALFGEEMVAQSINNIELMDVVNMNKAEDTQFGFGLFAADSDFDLAVDMGLGYEDNSVVTGEQYLYTLRFNNVDSTTQSRYASQIIATSDVVSLPPISDLSGRGGDSIAFLSWDISQSEDMFTSFIVERSDNNGTTFQPVNNKPIIYTSNADDIPGQINFTDALPNNTNTYVFRVKGKSPFGLTGPASDTIHLKGRPAPIEIAPGLMNVEEANPGTLKIDWEFDASFNSKIQGFRILRAPSRDSVFTPVTTSLLGSSVRTYTDNNPKSVNYYRVVAIDNNNHEINSLAVMGQLEDNTPPAAPASLIASIDDTGLLKLSWTKSSSDDAVGYRVYTSNQQAGEFSQLTQTYLKDTVYYYQINLKVLNEHIFYGVKAVDRHENYSDMSSVIQANRPDIIPPSPSRITNVTADYSSIFLTWESSTSDDVISQVLERKVHEIPGWVEIVSFDPRSNLSGIQDTSARVGIWYEYRLLAFDESGNFSSSEIVRARAIDSGVRPPIQNFTGQYMASDPPTVNLNWNYLDLRPNLVGFTIFRGADSTQMRTYKSISVEDALQMATAFGGGNGKLLDLGFIDDDLKFDMDVRGTYLIPSTWNPAAPGTVRPPSTGGPAPIIPTISSNPSIPTATPTGGSGGGGYNFELFYRVIAVFQDGSMSPLSSFVIISM